MRSRGVLESPAVFTRVSKHVERQIFAQCLSVSSWVFHIFPQGSLTAPRIWKYLKVMTSVCLFRDLVFKSDEFSKIYSRKLKNLKNLKIPRILGVHWIRKLTQDFHLAITYSPDRHFALLIFRWIFCLLLLLFFDSVLEMRFLN